MAWEFDSKARRQFEVVLGLVFYVKKIPNKTFLFLATRDVRAFDQNQVVIISFIISLTIRFKSSVFNLPSAVLGICPTTTHFAIFS